ncbi:MAG: VWA domain-containing protein [Bryobacteraceae bacterium]|nr:VWA domain-containing protein [Bryobacteraceae bacterium]
MILSRRGMLAMAAAGRLGALAPQPPTFRAEARLVEIHATVFDRRGRHVPGLRREDFEIVEDGHVEKAEIFESEESPFSVGLLLDVTGSMEEALPVVKQACLRMLDELRPQDHVAVFAFNDRFTQAVDFTADRRAAAAAIRRFTAVGRTALFDALARASIRMAERKGKKALIVLTDGNDNASTLTLDTALRRAQREAIPVHCIAQGEALRAGRLMDTLEKIAQVTGANSFRLEKVSKIGEVFAEITRDLAASYLLAYRPRPGSGEWRPIRVQVPRLKEARVRCRQGYYAG